MQFTRFRPQIFAGILLLGSLGVICLIAGQPELAGVCVGGIIAISKDLIQLEKPE